MAGMSNASSLLYLTMDNINWAGFYLYRDGELVLGPFQGKPACVRIQMGKGVCGTAAKTREIQIVEDDINSDILHAIPPPPNRR